MSNVSSIRIKRLKEQYFKQRPFLCHERPLAITLAYAENEDDPVIIRRAKAFKKHCETKSINILDNELIIGNAGSKPRAGIFSPEIIWDWVEEELDTMSTREYDPYYVSEESKAILREKVFPYWKGKSVQEYVLRHLPEENLRVSVDSPIMFLGEKLDNGPGQIVPDFEQAFKKGFGNIKREAESMLDNEGLKKTQSQIDFLKAVVICAEGMIILGKRHAETAGNLAASESSETRKKELIAIAKACEWVPENPPRDFHEALQFLWFCQIALFIEANAPSYSPGRIDEFLYSYYKTDIDNNVLTKEIAQELIECLWIKLSEHVNFQSGHAAKYWAGYMPYQLLHVGGTNSKGEDITNELSYMFLDASMNVRLFQPTISILVDPKTPDALLERACELAKLGDGHPSFFNNQAAIEMLKRKGIPEEIAMECSVAGCSEVKCKSMYEWSSGPWYNIGSMVEFALSDGYSKIKGDYYGARTGDPKTFKTYDDYLNAVKKQMAYIIHQCALANIILEVAHEKLLPLPFCSSFHSDCLANAKDVTQGGARYTLSPGLTGTGIADAINSIAAVKKLVYDDRVLTMEQLVEAIDADFEGYEDIRQMCKAVPKYGNDDEYVDEIGEMFTDILVDELESHKGKFGTKMCSAIVPTSANVPFGFDTGALASGKKSGEALADGISPNHGTNLHGPTAEVKSVARMRPSKHAIGTIYNMKFTPESLKGETGTKNLAALIRAYFELGGYHAQFNVVSAEVLKAAQIEPEKYQGLIVRVAGYSAYYTDLAKAVQDDIIGRTAQAF